MKENVYNFQLTLDWNLLRVISQIDRFDASWSSIEKKEGQSLKQLKSIATIRSVGASTRIEGSKMTDEQVEFLLSNIDISKIEDRDSQEVVGYFNVLDTISDSYEQIEISETNIKNLHNEDITEWIDFFLESLINVQNKLAKKLEVSGIENKLSPKYKAIYIYISENPGCKSGEIADKLNIPNPTVKRILSNLVSKELIEKYGKGAGTNYSIK